MGKDKGSNSDSRQLDQYLQSLTGMAQQQYSETTPLRQGLLGQYGQMFGIQPGQATQVPFQPGAQGSPFLPQQTTTPPGSMPYPNVSWGAGTQSAGIPGAVDPVRGPMANPQIPGNASTMPIKTRHDLEALPMWGSLSQEQKRGLTQQLLAYNAGSNANPASLQSLWYGAGLPGPNASQGVIPGAPPATGLTGLSTALGYDPKLTENTQFSIGNILGDAGQLTVLPDNVSQFGVAKELAERQFSRGRDDVLSMIGGTGGAGAINATLAGLASDRALGMSQFFASQSQAEQQARQQAINQALGLEMGRVGNSLNVKFANQGAINAANAFQASTQNAINAANIDRALGLATGGAVNSQGAMANAAGVQAQIAAQQSASNAQAKSGKGQGLGYMAGQALAAGKCWVAREVYGEQDPRWMLFRDWLTTKAPRWFHDLYVKYGEIVADLIRDRALIKAAIRLWMNGRIA